MTSALDKYHVPLVILLLQALHVFSNVTTEDVLLEDLVVELLAFWVIAGETLLVVRDVETAIGCTLEGTEHTRTSRSALETDIEVALEGAGGILLIESLSQSELTIGLSDTLVFVGKTELGQSTTSNEETSGISCDTE